MPLLWRAHGWEGLGRASSVGKDLLEEVRPGQILSRSSAHCPGGAGGRPLEVEKIGCAERGSRAGNSTVGLVKWGQCQVDSGG